MAPTFPIKYQETVQPKTYSPSLSIYSLKFQSATPLPSLQPNPPWKLLYTCLIWYLKLAILLLTLYFFRPPPLNILHYCRSISYPPPVCSAEKCDKNEHLLGFIPQTYFFLFVLFINICTFFRINLLYEPLFSCMYI